MLLAWWFLALLITAAAAFPLAAVGFGIRRHRRRKTGRPVMSGWRLAARRVTLVFGTVVFALAAVAAGVNDHYSYIPSFHALFGDVSPDLVSHPVAARAELARRAQRDGGDSGIVPAAVKIPDHGTVEKVSIDGPVSGVGGRDAYVYLPPEYFDPARAAQRFPVLYLLHGSPGVAVDWLRAGWADRAMDDLLTKHRVAPFVIVMPDVNGGFRRDSECEDILPSGPKTQTYLVNDVVAYVDANYRTIPQRGGRVIGGLSTGGYCAVNLTLRHQDLFSGIVSHSGYDRPDHNLYTGDLFNGDRKEAEANTPGLYLPTIPLTHPLGVYLDVGMGDNGSRIESTDMARTFEKRGASVTFHDFAGESHSWGAWRRNLYSSLPWVSSWFVTTGVVPEPAAGTPLVEAAPPPPTAAPGATFAAEPAPTDDDTTPPDAMHAAPAPPAPPSPEPAKPEATGTAAATPAGGPAGERHPSPGAAAHPRHRGSAAGGHHQGGVTAAAVPGAGAGPKAAAGPKPDTAATKPHPLPAGEHRGAS